MKVCLYAGLLALVLFSPAWAETLPEFWVRPCSYDATHIVVVKVEAAKEGKFKVLQSWKGDLGKGTILEIPALVKEAGGEMVLFMRRDPKLPARWQSASRFSWRTSVVWLDGEKVRAVRQRINPGPAEIQPLYGMETRGKLEEAVRFYLRTEEAFRAVKAAKDVDARVKVLAEIVNGDYDHKDEALAKLGECGPKALPTLRKVLLGPPSYTQMYAIQAMAVAGGREVMPELTKLLRRELAYWKEVGPTLKKGWWGSSKDEPSIRLGKLHALISVYSDHPTPDLERAICAVRDYMRTLPAVDADPGLSSTSRYCELILTGQIK